ncbi:hypothetical protein [Frankia sp. Cas3]|uniref:hypothetical protein n=1 Tax=Frankia sp. Cas3 TaxID=3073926 RepID=UPI002AD1D2CD|nr:hypothetical protein [Frankia sp. Cas3]
MSRVPRRAASTVLTGLRRSNAPELPDNRVHYVRDTAWHEDACRAHLGDGLRNLAILRNLALGLLRLQRITKIKETVKHIARDRNRVLPYLAT